ncbi:MAG: IPT/TIG domain-containing protein [Acidimicrobiales bacterium]
MTKPRSSRRLQRSLATAGVGALVVAAAFVPVGGAAASPARSAPSAQFVAIGAGPLLPRGDRVIGPLASSTPLQVDVVLSPRDPSALAAAAAAVSSPGSTEYRHYLSTPAFRAEFAPSAASLAAVRATLERDGLTPLAPADDGLVLPVRATAARMSAAFHTTLETVRLANGKTGRLSTSAPRLPEVIASSVLAVVGLDEVIVPMPLESAPGRTSARQPAGAASPAPAASSLVSSGGPHACADASKAAAEGSAFTDDQVAHAYGMSGLYSKGYLGAGETVGLFELDPFSMKDLRVFDECYFGADHTDQVSVVNVDGGEPSGYGEGEAALDVEDVSAYAPAAKVDVYEAPDSLIGWIDEMVAIVGQDKASVVSVSYGLCETQMSGAAPGLAQSENILFEEAALQGQSILVASGDAGSEACARSGPEDESLSVSDPASQPYVTSVGGTSLKSDSFPPVETVWNDGGNTVTGPEGATGGGISQTWPMPAWQSASGVPGVLNSYSTSAKCHAPGSSDCAEDPDVAASADQYHGDTIVYGGGWTTIGGTSAASPKWAAILAITNDYCTANGKGTIGFADPALFKVASLGSGTYAEAFNDITKGNNDVLGIHHHAYPATVGYDLATGLGSPRVTGPGGSPGLAALLCSVGSSDSARPTLSSISPSVGSYVGGTTVTLHGTGLSGVTAVQFGPSPVSVSPSDITEDGTVITVDTPASPTQPFNGGTPVGGVLVAAVGPSGMSEPSPSVVFHYVAGSDSSPVPSVYYISPTSAPADGTVTIYGSGFEEGLGAATAPTVDFGGIASPAVDVVSDTELSATVPAEQAGTACLTAAEGVPRASFCQAELTVANDNGTSATQDILPPAIGSATLLPPTGTENVPAVTEFDYSATPVISKLTPTVIGTQSYDFYPGGPNPFTPNFLTVVGSGIDPFSFEGVEATVPGEPRLDQELEFELVSETTMYVLPPSYGSKAPPTADLTLQFIGASSNSVAVTVAPKTISVTGISTHESSVAGGSTVTVTGSGFSSAQGVWVEPAYPGFGGSSTTDITVESSTKLSVVIPPDLAGVGILTVCNPSVCAGSSKVSEFAYYEPVAPELTSMSPTTGSAGGGETLLIAGADLWPVVSVKFGTVASPSVTRKLSRFSSVVNEIAAVVPRGVVGSAVKVVVTTYGGSATVHGRFHYARGAPGGPTAVSAKVRASGTTVTWSAPRADGGSPITGYTVTGTSPAVYTKYGRINASSESVRVGPAARQAVLPLAPFEKWRISVAAKNALGSQLARAKGTYTPSLGDDGYVIAAPDGTVIGYGAFGKVPRGLGGAKLRSPIVSLALTPSGQGDWLLAANGHVRDFGDAVGYGSLRSGSHTVPATVIVALPNGRGYWIVTADGQVFGFGAAKPLGGVKRKLASPVVAAAATADGGGYFLVTASGVVFAFGDARYHGDLHGTHFAGQVVAISPDPKGGYRLFTSTGSVSGYGPGATPHGSLSLPAGGPQVVGAVATPDGRGYWLLESDGTVHAFGDAVFEGDAKGQLEAGRAQAIAI